MSLLQRLVGVLYAVNAKWEGKLNTRKVNGSLWWCIKHLRFYSGRTQTKNVIAKYGYSNTTLSKGGWIQRVLREHIDMEQLILGDCVQLTSVSLSLYLSFSKACGTKSQNMGGSTVNFWALRTSSENITRHNRIMMDFDKRMLFLYDSLSII